MFWKPKSKPKAPTFRVLSTRPQWPDLSAHAEEIHTKWTNNTIETKPGTNIDEVAWKPDFTFEQALAQFKTAFAKYDDKIGYTPFVTANLAFLAINGSFPGLQVGDFGNVTPVWPLRANGQHAILLVYESTILVEGSTSSHGCMHGLHQAVAMEVDRLAEMKKQAGQCWGGDSRM